MRSLNKSSRPSERRFLPDLYARNRHAGGITTLKRTRSDGRRAPVEGPHLGLTRSQLARCFRSFSVALCPEYSDYSDSSQPPTTSIRIHTSALGLGLSTLLSTFSLASGVFCVTADRYLFVLTGRHCRGDPSRLLQHDHVYCRSLWGCCSTYRTLPAGLK